MRNPRGTLIGGCQGRKKYPDEASAQKVAESIFCTYRNIQRAKVYECKVCKHFHLSYRISSWR